MTPIKSLLHLPAEIQVMILTEHFASINIKVKDCRKSGSRWSRKQYPGGQQWLAIALTSKTMHATSMKRFYKCAKFYLSLKYPEQDFEKKYGSIHQLRRVEQIVANVGAADEMNFDKGYAEGPFPALKHLTIKDDFTKPDGSQGYDRDKLQLIAYDCSVLNISFRAYITIARPAPVEWNYKRHQKISFVIRNEATMINEGDFIGSITVHEMVSVDEAYFNDLMSKLCKCEFLRVGRQPSKDQLTEGHATQDEWVVVPYFELLHKPASEYFGRGKKHVNNNATWEE